MALYNTEKILQPNGGYSLNGETITTCYTKNGIVAYQENLTKELLFIVPMSDWTSNLTQPQGMDVYNGYYCQFFTQDLVFRIFDMNDYSLVAEYPMTDVQHGNAIQFGTVEQDTGFPLLYVSEWGESRYVDSKVIDILKIGLDGYEKVGSYTLPDSVGYHPNQITDWEHGIIYAVGYSEDYYTATVQPNTITALRMSDMEIIEQYQVPYLGVAQGLKFKNGQIIFIGSKWEDAYTRISFINVATHEVVEKRIAKTVHEEDEDLAIIGDEIHLSNWMEDMSDGKKRKARMYKIKL